MKRLLLIASIFALTLSSGVANAQQVHAKIDNESAALFISEKLIANIDTDSVDCDSAPEDIAKGILSDPHNKKLLLAAKDKKATAFLKLAGVTGAIPKFFDDTALLAVENICDTSGDDPQDEE